MSEDFKGSNSSYNEASLKMLRIDTLQKRLNDFLTNPLQYDSDLDKYYYELSIATLSGLYSEIHGLLTGNETKECDRRLNSIIKTKTYLPIFSYKNNQSLSGDKRIKFVNYNHLEFLNGQMFYFNLYLRDLMQVHKIGTPTTEEEEDWD